MRQTHIFEYFIASSIPTLYNKNLMNASAIVLVVALLLAAGFMSFQYLKGIGKSFQSEESTSQLTPPHLSSNKKQQAEDAEEQRKAYMEAVKQRMRDSQRR